MDYLDLINPIIPAKKKVVKLRNKKMNTLKSKIIRFFIVLFLIMGIGVFMGWKLYDKTKGQKIVKIEIEKPVQIPVEWNEPEYIAMCFEKGARDYGINEAFFWAVKECEGCETFKVSNTGDYGDLCLNFNWAKKYGAKDLSDVQNPCQAVKFAVNILKDGGLQRWTKWRCIQERLVFEAPSLKK